LGRIDQQVKIRGFRIELGDIENAICRIPDIREVAVVIKDNNDGLKNINAYFTASKSIDISWLRSSLKKELPDYMVPAYMMQIDRIPVTHNGKLDRRALPQIEVKSCSEYIEPRTETEKIIAKAIREVLCTERLGIDDSFFEMGGDSIKAMRVIAAISKDMSIYITDIFKLQTVRQIAEAVDSRSEANIIDKLNNIKKRWRAQAEKQFELSDEDKLEIEKYHERNKLYSSCYEVEDERTNNVFLTGATGYLGIHLLREMLCKTKDSFYLVIRADNSIDAGNRLNTKWKYYFGSEFPEEYTRRVHCITGDISKDKLGLCNEDYEEMAKSVDSIINCAANVNHYSQYEKSYGVNVQGVLNLIDFAKKGKAKVIHHMSTVSVAAGKVADKKRIIFTEESLDVGQKPDNVYINTKLMAEKALVNIRQSGVETNIYRLGDIQCQSTTGIFQENAGENAFVRAIKALTVLRAYPSGSFIEFDFSCVDNVAEACCKLINNKILHNQIYHVRSKSRLSISELMASFSECGYGVKEYEVSDFLNLLIEANKESRLKEDIEMLLLHSGMFDENIEMETQYLVLDDKTNYILECLGFGWKEIDSKVLTLMIKHLEHIEFLKPDNIQR
jgi:thioester reductase-like protein